VRAISSIGVVGLVLAALVAGRLFGEPNRICKKWDRGNQEEAGLARIQPLPEVKPYENLRLFSRQPAFAVSNRRAQIRPTDRA